MDKSEHDLGFDAGARSAALEALRICRAHIDRLEPARQARIREALEALEASMRSIFRQRGFGAE